MNGYSEMVLTSCELPEKARHYLTLVRGFGERAAALARSMMDLARTPRGLPSWLAIDESVRELVKCGALPFWRRISLRCLLIRAVSYKCC
jgi:hypothetical protein